MQTQILIILRKYQCNSGIAAGSWEPRRRTGGENEPPSN